MALDTTDQARIGLFVRMGTDVAYTFNDGDATVPWTQLTRLSMANRTVRKINPYITQQDADKYYAFNEYKIHDSWQSFDHNELDQLLSWWTENGTMEFFIWVMAPFGRASMADVGDETEVKRQFQFSFYDPLEAERQGHTHLTQFWEVANKYTSIGIEVVGHIGCPDAHTDYQLDKSQRSPQYAENQIGQVVDLFQRHNVSLAMDNSSVRAATGKSIAVANEFKSWADGVNVSGGLKRQCYTEGTITKGPSDDHWINFPGYRESSKFPSRHHPIDHTNANFYHWDEAEFPTRHAAGMVMNIGTSYRNTYEVGVSNPFGSAGEKTEWLDRQTAEILDLTTEGIRVGLSWEYVKRAIENGRTPSECLPP